MHLSAFLLLSLALILGHVSPVNPSGIPDINKGLNLTEGDIMEPTQGSAIHQWDIPVPYKLSVNLSMNVRGVILRAFEQFRLKSCIDFKPREAEKLYISVENREGCWSYVGRSSPGGQTLSIGNGCGIKAIVEHEFLHALGLYHEHTRYDRDDYVTIRYENIMKGNESYFKKSSENVSATPYDYYSVMHFDKNAFSNGNGSTIITKQPELQDVIGQLMEMSEYDAIKLNKLYKCNSSISFLDHCSFDDESLCQMSVSSAADDGWQRVKSVSGISVTDHTHLGKEQNGTSFFMHFSTEGRKEGDAATIESKTLTPTRAGKVQCLQFYYYHSGDESDQLNIWIREYQNETDSKGTLRLMDQIKEIPGKYWKLHNVVLNASKSFQVVFEGRKGAVNSSGGFSLDDINISETECPHIWQIRDFEKVLILASTINGPLFYSSDGYRFGLQLLGALNAFTITVFSASGVYDDQLRWPCPWTQLTIQILDQNAHIQKRMSFERSFTTDPKRMVSGGRYFWGNPRDFQFPVKIGKETVFLGGSGKLYFQRKDFPKREFIKGGDLILLFSIQDISGLQDVSLPVPNATVNYFNVSTGASAQQEPWTTRGLSTLKLNSSTTGTSTTATQGPTEEALSTSQPNSTTTGTSTTATQGPTEDECVSIFCNSSARTASSLIILLLCFLSLEIQSG